MKHLFWILLFTFTHLACAAESVQPSTTPSVTGTVMEVKNVESYTYIRLKTAEGETWAAVNKSTVKKGSKVTIDNVMVMNNFESRSLKQTFKTIIFGTLAGTGAAKSGSAMAPGHPAASGTVDTTNLRVPKATGENAWTVAEIVTKSAELKDKPVVVRAKIVKYNPGIMGKNWIHLRDGTGSAAENTNDILATTTVEAKLGDIVTVKGVVRTDKDFGSGYAYKTMIEEATIQK